MLKFKLVLSYRDLLVVMASSSGSKRLWGVKCCGGKVPIKWWCSSWFSVWRD